MWVMYRLVVCWFWRVGDVQVSRVLVLLRRVGDVQVGRVLVLLQTACG